MPARNFLLVICNYISYKNLQKNSLPNPFAREKAEDMSGTMSVHTELKSISFSAVDIYFSDAIEKYICTFLELFLVNFIKLLLVLQGKYFSKAT